MVASPGLGLRGTVTIPCTHPPTRISHKWSPDPENMGWLCGLAHLPCILPSYEPWRGGNRASAEKGMGFQNLPEEEAEHSPSQSKSADCGQGKLQLGLGAMTVALLRKTGGEAMRHLQYSDQSTASHSPAWSINREEA